MQTILGAGGAIGKEVAKALTSYTNTIRLVSRNPEKVNSGDMLVQADLTKADEVMAAVKGSEIVYLTVGLPYKLSVWQTQWPIIMKNVIDACATTGAKLVFFDNIYMYDNKNLNPITEANIIAPKTKKGQVRANLVRMIWEAVQADRINAVIARCADYYGPGITGTSLLVETVFNPLSTGGKANWLGASNFKHSFTYTPDAGRATAMLGNTPDAFGQTWHLPTAGNPMTGSEWIEAIAGELGVKPKSRSVGSFMTRVMGLFSTPMKEMVEMLYQNTQDYVFNSDKFEGTFDMKPTSYAQGIREIVASDYQK